MSAARLPLPVLMALALLAAAPGPAAADEAARKLLQEAAPAPHHVRFVYVLPADGTDRQLDTDGVLARSVTRMQTWLAKETAGRRLRVVEKDGVPEILFLQFRQADAELSKFGMELRRHVEPELHREKFLKADEIYVFYYDGTGPETCGSAPPVPLLPGVIVFKYLNGRKKNLYCDAPRAPAGEMQFFDYGAVHEVFHVLGAVPACAPNYSDAWGGARLRRPIRPHVRRPPAMDALAARRGPQRLFRPRAARLS